ncbi:hypothetical protein [Clostridium vincentii]|uniref:Uncharacterized protein n=1 Tax=Clostridium vincentii TaxID=52704 RepID=A0A2T0BGZ9_9CLOT|nr:hypothetical protein CLVI_11490 [Clostridium vincentii]
MDIKVEVLQNKNNILEKDILHEVLMDFNEFNNFEDFAKKCGYTGRANSNKSGESQNNNDSEGCDDIPGGFQDLNPQLFTVIGELLGSVMAGNMPFNVQNAVGNWLELLGQVILTCNAQQQYLQSGPGRYYNINNKNINNPFCSSNSNNSTNNSSCGELDELKKGMNDLMREVKELKKEINELKSD